MQSSVNFKEFTKSNQIKLTRLGKGEGVDQLIISKPAYSAIDFGILIPAFV
jgi:hypothetical protein